MKRFKRHALGCVLVLTLMATGPALALDASTIRAGELNVPPGQQRLVMMPGPIERVAIGDPEIADVSVTGDAQVMLTGNKRGSTSLIAWMRDGQSPMRFPVNIAAADAPVLGAQADDFSVQVQTDIQIAELSRSTLRQIGFNFASNAPGESAIGVSPPGKSAGIDPMGAGLDILSSGAFKPIGDAFNLVISDSNKSTAGYLSILERRGLMNILSEPSLVAMSGQTATFLAGGRVSGSGRSGRRRYRWQLGDHHRVQTVRYSTDTDADRAFAGQNRAQTGPQRQRARFFQRGHAQRRAGSGAAQTPD